MEHGSELLEGLEVFRHPFNCIQRQMPKSESWGPRGQHCRRTGHRKAFRNRTHLVLPGAKQKPDSADIGSPVSRLELTGPGTSGVWPKRLWSLFKKRKMKSKSSTCCPFSAANESQMSFRGLRIQNSGSFRAFVRGPESVILRQRLQGAGAGKVWDKGSACL